MTLDWPLILAFHHIDLKSSSRYVLAVDRFERELSAMLAAGFTPLTLAEALACGPHGTGLAPEKSFTITFDDGLVSFGDLAVPVLERLGLKAATTIFVPTRWVGQDNAWRDEPTLLQRLMPWGETAEALLDWDRIEELAARGFAFECHGHGHLAMNMLTYDEALADLTTSLALLAEHGIDAKYFAWPYGWHSEDAKRAVVDAGLQAAFSVKWGGRDVFEVRRIPVYGTDGAITRRLKLSGRYFDAFDFAARLAGKKRYKR
jgi:peptidoglycan/xylan/chitin deacetylase (PgdA/CDA1 family)